jgi:hypothetical protein
VPIDEQLDPPARGVDDGQSAVCEPGQGPQHGGRRQFSRKPKLPLGLAAITLCLSRLVQRRDSAQQIDVGRQHIRLHQVVPQRLHRAVATVPIQ